MFNIFHIDFCFKAVFDRLKHSIHFKIYLKTLHSEIILNDKISEMNLIKQFKSAVQIIKHNNCKLLLFRFRKFPFKTAIWITIAFTVRELKTQWRDTAKA